MVYQPTEDITGDIDPFAIPEEGTDDITDEDQPTAETILIKEIREYCNREIKKNNSFDVLTLPKNATPEDKIAVFDEMFNYKGLVHHLRQILEIINNKVKEN